jgi:glycosyltransferase involved in cell wall biosynthesis
MPDTRLWVAGELDSADPVNERTQAWLTTSAHNTLLGQMVEVPAFLRSVDVLCFPSHREGLPNAVIEAAACGVPAVAWDVTGTRDAIIDGQTGFLVPLGNHDAMAGRITQILNDSQLAHRLGVASRDVARERFDSRLVQAAYVDFIARL